jgi:membrane fusion protein, multidrug efflux system
MTPTSCLAKAFSIALVFCLSGCEKKTVQTEAPPPPEVLVTEVVKGDVPTIGEWVGTLDGDENAVIRRGAM